MAFADVLRLGLQPSALDLDPGFARAQFIQDLDRTQQRGGAVGRQQAQQHRYDFDRDLQARDTAARRTHRNLTPQERRYHAPAGEATAPLLARLMRDAALQQYDAAAPQLREAQRAGAR